MVHDSVPGIVNGNKEQKQRCGTHEEQGWARMGLNCVCRYSQEYICRAWQQNMRKPILEYRLVGPLRAHTAAHHYEIHYSTETY